MKKLTIAAVLLFVATASAFATGPYWDIKPSTWTSGAMLPYPVTFKGPRPFIDVSAFGAVCDGATDDAAAINAAITAAPSQGAEIRLPPGTCVIKSAILQNKTSILRGAGRDSTTIKIASASADGITVSATRCSVRDLTITSTMTRTGIGLHITSGAESWFSDLYIINQSTGIYNAAGGNDFEKIITGANSHAGFVFDGSGGAQNEIGVRFVQSNGNGGDGFYVKGPGTGLRFTVVTAAGNTGAGLRLVNPDGSGGKAVNDVWVNSSEFSGNGGSSIDASKMGASYVLIVGNNFLEVGGATNVDISTSIVGVTITGNTISGSSSMGIDTSGATDVSITGNWIASNGTYGVKLNGTRVSLSNNIVSASAGTQSYGLYFAGSNGVSITGGDYSGNTTAALTGSIPTNTVIVGAVGLATGIGVPASVGSPIPGNSNFLLPAGTAAANGSAMKFSSGTVLTSPEAGAVEYNGTNLFLTNASSSRKTIAYTDSNITGTAGGLSSTLAIGSGGTNSATAMSGSSIMVSNGSSIIQGAAGTSTTLLHGNASGTPTYSAVSLSADVTGTLSGSSVSGGTFGAVNGSALTNLSGSNVSGGTFGAVDGSALTNLTAANVTGGPGSDGWIAAGVTWTYVSANSFSVSGDKTAVYAVGDAIKMTNSTTKYFYVTAVNFTSSVSTVTVTGGTDYTLANAAISSPFYSKSVHATGFPNSFTYNCVSSGWSGTPTQTEARFNIVGRTVYVKNDVSGTSNATTTVLLTPVATRNGGGSLTIPLGNATDNGIAGTGVEIGATTVNSTTVNLYRSRGGLAWTAAGSKSVSLQYFYEIP